MLIPDVTKHHIILQHVIVVHLKRLCHDAIQLRVATHRGTDTHREQTTGNEDQDTCHSQTNQDVWCQRRGVVVDHFRMEPLVVDALQVTRLFQTGVLIVNSINDIQLVTDDAQFARRHIGYLVEHQTVNRQLLDFIL